MKIMAAATVPAAADLPERFDYPQHEGTNAKTEATIANKSYADFVNEQASRRCYRFITESGSC